MSQRTAARSFSSGELTPELFGRMDLAKFQSGLALCRNFVILPHGPAANRSGTEFVKEVKNSLVKTRLIPFTYSVSQTMAIEVGAGYFRFHSQASTLLYSAPAAWSGATNYVVGDMASSGGVNYYCVAAHINHAPPNGTYWYALPADLTYEIPNSYAAADLMDIHYVQSADVLTLTHPNYPVQELRRLGATTWTWTAPVFQAPTNVPTSLAAAATPTSATTTFYQYVVTSVNKDNLEETVASALAIGPSITLNNVSKANPCVITTPSSQVFTVGEPIFISGVLGMTQINGGPYYVNTVIDTLNFTIANAAGVPIDSTGFSAYTSGGSITLQGVRNDLTLANHYNTLTWTAPVTGTVVRYNIYKLANGLYGYIGQAAGLSFIDNNITPDVSQTPPINDTGFNDAVGNYPGAVSYFEQRRCFAGTTNLPQNFWGTKSGTESNMSYSIPVRDDNRIAFRIAAREASAIRHIVPAASLILLTPSCEYRVNPQGDVITPSSVTVKPQSYIGCNNVTPVLVGNSVLFAQARGGRIREMSYSWQANGYQTNDISIMAPHLFEYNNVLDMAYSKAPYPILWAVSTNGSLLGMTYVPEQQVAAWHHHDTTNGTFEAVCTITEIPAGQLAAEDMLYAIVNRTIGGVTKRYVERMHTRYFAAAANAFFVDCGATYSGAPTTTVSGLTWLEGQTVSILADGAVMPQQVVTGGTITLSHTASVIQVGLPITADLQTLPLAMQIDNAAGVGKTKNVNKVWIRVNRSSGIFAGPSFSNLTEVKERTIEPWGSPPALKSGEVSVVISPSWGADGAVCIRQSDPLPLTVVSIALEVATGG